MLEEVGSYPHNLSNSSPVVYGDLIYLSTSNGQDESHVHIPSPQAPAVIALNKNTGKLVWEDNSVQDRILHGQWSTPAVGTIGGVVQVVSAQGDGWVRGYEAESGKKLWEFDTNPKDAVWPRTRNEVIATPVIYQDRVYIGNGQDPEHGEGVGHFYAIDATKRGDITQTGRIWHFDKIRRTISTAAIADGLVYVSDFSGYLHCLDANTGQEYWQHDMLAAVWASPFLIDGKVYLGDEDGDVVVMAHSKEKVVIGGDEHGQRGVRNDRPGQRNAVPQQPQPALRHLRNEIVACGQRQHCSSRSCCRQHWAHSVQQQRQARSDRLDPSGCARRCLATVPRNSQSHRRLRQRASRHAQRPLELRHEGRDRLLCCHRRRCRLRWRRQR